MTDLATAIVAQLDAQLVRYVGCTELALRALEADDLDRLAVVLDERGRIHDELERASATIDRLRFDGPASAARVEHAVARVRAAVDAQARQATRLHERLLDRAEAIRAAISDELTQLNAAGLASVRYTADELSAAGAGAAARLDVRL